MDCEKFAIQPLDEVVNEAPKLSQISDLIGKGNLNIDDIRIIILNLMALLNREIAFYQGYIEGPRIPWQIKNCCGDIITVTNTFHIVNEEIKKLVHTDRKAVCPLICKIIRCSMIILNIPRNINNIFAPNNSWSELFTPLIYIKANPTKENILPTYDAVQIKKLKEITGLNFISNNVSDYDPLLIVLEQYVLGIIRLDEICKKIAHK